jgi:hypothetical protein
VTDQPSWSAAFGGLAVRTAPVVNGSSVNDMGGHWSRVCPRSGPINKGNHRKGETLALPSWRAPALAAVAVAAVTAISLVAMPASGSTTPARLTQAQLKQLVKKELHQTILDKKLVAGPSHAPNGITQYTSGNWAGYVALPSGSTTSFTKIGAAFEVPSADCTAGGVGTGDAFAYHWIGLDGFSDGTVEQDGVGVLCEGGTAYYISWWETYPGGINVTENVNPGDEIQAYVTFNGSDYVMTVKDQTTDTYVEDVTEPCESGSTCDNSSAETITEGYPSSPWLGTADYGSEFYNAIEVTNQAGTAGAISRSTWTDGEITAEQGSTITSEPGRLYSVGTGSTSANAFQVFWHNVS